MAESEPGHPDELASMLRNWLAQANSPIGSLPEGMDAVEWAVRRFIDSWRKPVRSSIELIEECLQSATAAIHDGNTQKAIAEIDSIRQIVGESLRDDLGLYDWNKDEN